MNSYCVYKHTSPDGKVYIGVTCQNPKKRWRNGRGYSYNSHFIRAITKYGWDNFRHEIIADGVSKEQAYEIEIELISKYKSTDQRYGYNHRNGGAGSNEGIVSSDESRRKRSIAMKGRFIGDYVGGKSVKAKKVNQYSTDGVFLKTWDSTTDIQRELGINYTSIVKCCRRDILSAGGYIWTYYDDECDISDIVSKVNAPKFHTEEQKERIRHSMTGKLHLSLEKHIIGTNIINGDKVYYRSMAEAEKDGFDRSCISACISPNKPHSKTHRGYTWELAKEEA